MSAGNMVRFKVITIWLFVALFHAQRAQRGYLLSGSEPYLEPYDAALEFQKATERVSFMMIFLIGVVFLWQVKSRLLY